MDYRKVQNILTNLEINVNVPYLVCFVFCVPQNSKSKQFREFVFASYCMYKERDKAGEFDLDQF